MSYVHQCLRSGWAEARKQLGPELLQFRAAMEALASAYNGRPSPDSTQPSTTAALLCVMAWTATADVPADAGTHRHAYPHAYRESDLTPFYMMCRAACVLQRYGLSKLLQSDSSQPGWAHDACVEVLAGTMLMNPTGLKASTIPLSTVPMFTEMVADWVRLAARLLDAALAEAAAAAGRGEGGRPGTSSSGRSSSGRQQSILRLVHYYGLPRRILAVCVIVCVDWGEGMGRHRRF